MTAVQAPSWGEDKDGGVWGRGSAARAKVRDWNKWRQSGEEALKVMNMMFFKVRMRKESKHRRPWSKRKKVLNRTKCYKASIQSLFVFFRAQTSGRQTFLVARPRVMDVCQRSGRSISTYPPPALCCVLHVHFSPYPSLPLSLLFPFPSHLAPLSSLSTIKCPPSAMGISLPKCQFLSNRAGTRALNRKLATEC